MRGAVETDVGTDEGARADGDEARVGDDTVKVDEDALAHPHVEAVVDVDGRLNPGIALELGLVCRGVIQRRGKRRGVLDDAVGRSSILSPIDYSNATRAVIYVHGRTEYHSDHARNNTSAHLLSPKLDKPPTGHLAGVVEAVTGVLAAGPRGHQLRCKGMIQLPAEHLLLLCRLCHGGNWQSAPDDQ